MSSSSSNPQSPPPIQLEPDPGNSNHTHPPETRSQHVFPLVTPMRICYFSLSLIGSLLAYGSFTQTEFYKSSHRQPFLILAVLIGHTVWLIFLLFFRFCSVSRHHYVVKSLGEYLALLMASFFILGIGHEHNHLSDEVAAGPVGSLIYGNVEASEVAVFATCVFLDIDAFGIINLLMPGHHYSLLEAMVTLTLHLGLLVGSLYLKIIEVFFIFVILLIKNFLWRHVKDAQATTNEQHRLAWVALEVV